MGEAKAKRIEKLLAGDFLFYSVYLLFYQAPSVLQVASFMKVPTLLGEAPPGSRKAHHRLCGHLQVSAG